MYDKVIVMAGSALKVESGLQLLARLTKKTGLNNFYPLLFDQGPEAGDVIELYSNHTTKQLLQDIITESLIPCEIGGVEAGVILINTDGHLTFDCLLNSLKRKIQERIVDKEHNLLLKFNKLLDIALKNLFLINIDHLNQFYITVQNLENILSKHSNISLVAFDSLTAFYWLEQSFKITKMDTYLKTILQLIQKVTKDYKITIIYTRPEYFSSTKETIDNLEKCSKRTSHEQVNYRIQVTYNNDGKKYLNIQNYNKIVRKEFFIKNNEFILFKSLKL